MLLEQPFPMIVLWGPQLIQIYNDGYRVIAAGKHPKALGQPTQECWPEAWHINGPIHERIFATGQPTYLEDQRIPLARHGPLEDVWFTISYSPARDEAGNIAGVFIAMMETTQKVLAERQRRQAGEALQQSEERLQAMTLILGPVRKTLVADNLTEEQQRDLAVVERNARTLLRNVNDLLDLCKLDAGRIRIEYAEIDLARLVRFVASHFESVADDRQIRFAVETPENLLAQADPEKVQRVLFNLLSNAFKFTPAQGAVRLNLHVEDARALFVVEDTGPGIPAEMRQAIFERFRQVDSSATRRYGGTGLSLAIVKEFVNLHHGTIEVTEAPIGGARFAVELPLAAPSGAEVRVASAFASEEGAQEAIAELRTQVGLPTHHEQAIAPDAALVLVVEDNPEMNAFVAESLGDHYRVIRAFDGLEGLEKATQHKPDLIISDLMMPRMSGEDLVRAVRHHRELDGVPILLPTAKAEENLRVELLSTGAQDCLVKPFVTEELVVRAGGLIARKKEAEDALRRSEQRYRTLFESIDEGFCIIQMIFDEHGRPVDCRFLETNPSFERQSGLTNAPGRTMRELAPKHEEDWFEVYGQIALTGQPMRFENRAEQLGRWYDVYAFRFGRAEDRQVAVLFSDITQRKRAEQALRELNEMLEQRVAERTAELEHRADQLRTLAKQLTHAEQKERQRVAYILHEHFQQLLVGAKFNLSMISPQGQDPLMVSSLQETDRILDKAIDESRSLTIELSPPMLRHARMSDVLRWLGRWMQQKHGLAVRVNVDDQADPQDPQVRELLFQAVRELLLNVAKFAQVDQAAVEMIRKDDQQVQITVSDGGVGFDVASDSGDGSADKGFGLFSIQERLELLGGRMVIDSVAGRGTRITLHAPAHVITGTTKPASEPSRDAPDQIDT